MVVPSNVSYWRLTLGLSQLQKGHAGTTVPSEELTWPRLSLRSPTYHSVPSRAPGVQASGVVRGLVASGRVEPSRLGTSPATCAARASHNYWTCSLHTD